MSRVVRIAIPPVPIERLAEIRASVDRFSAHTEKGPGARREHRNALAVADASFRDLAERPDDRNARTRLATALFDLAILAENLHDDPGAARAFLEGAVACDPDHTHSLYALAELLVRTTGEFAEAGVYFERMIAIEPGHVPSLIGAGCAAAARGDRARARDRFEDALYRNPNDATARANLARLEEEEGNLDRARALAESSLALDPDAGSARSLLARLGPLPEVTDRTPPTSGR